MTRTVRLAEIAFVRSGDKGDISDMTVFATDRAAYRLIVEQLPVARVRDALQSVVRGDVRRYEVPNLLAVKFVCEAALGGGGPASLRADNLGKALGGALLYLTVEVPDLLATQPRAPRDPYAGQPWLTGGATGSGSDERQSRAERGNGG